MANQPDVVVVDKRLRTAEVIDVDIPRERNIRKKEHEKIQKYQNMEEELGKM